MANGIRKTITPVSFDEYGLLKKVIMCEPTFLSVPKEKIVHTKLMLKKR